MAIERPATSPPMLVLVPAHPALIRKRRASFPLAAQWRSGSVLEPRVPWLGGSVRLVGQFSGLGFRSLRLRLVLLNQVLVRSVGVRDLLRRESLAALAAVAHLSRVGANHYMIHLFRPHSAVGRLRRISRRLWSL
jgi:hypothetical protein